MEQEDIAPRQVRRFVPTLTEVIAPQPQEEAGQPMLPPLFPEPGGTQPASLAPTPPPTPVAGGNRELAEAVLTLIGADLDRAISETVARVLHEQMLGFNTRLQKAVADVVRESVARSGM